MDDYRKDEYFNNLCTQPPDDYDNIESHGDLPNMNSACLASSDSTDTEESASSSVKQNCLPKIINEDITVPGNIKCATVNFEPDAKKPKASSSGILLRTTSPPSDKHRCYDVLQGRRKAVKKRLRGYS